MIKLDHIYTPNDLPPGTQGFLSNRFSQYVVPTEVVINSIDQNILPLVGRTYQTNLYYLRSNIVDYNVLRLEPDFKGTSNYKSIVMSEVWDDHGDDGHVDYCMVGYVFKVV